MIGKYDYPDILMCPLPTMDHQKLRKNGYITNQAYYAGRIKGSEFDGWAGKEDKNPAALMKELSFFKSSNDCPQVKANLIKIGV